MKIALAQLNTSVGDLTGNTKKIIRSIHDAAEKNADLVVFPELTVPGYPPQDLIFEPGFVEKNLIACQKIAHETRHLKIASLVGYIDNPSKEVYHNAVSVISGGRCWILSIKPCFRPMMCLMKNGTLCLQRK